MAHLLVDRRDLLDEALAVAVLELEDLAERPVEVVGDEGYLLVQVIEGVASYPPISAVSTWNVWLHSGHVTVIWLDPLVLRRR